ncbi:hypothetical protein N7457_001382 [Penicillium paradoxum]|uniref:uncharacterized protein n=1 Tax=Penicillium paradoxum TaxID=176176 RepID=UPI0025483240|nr:uncharacterized protein N7457_001382 [Penicillium paradoxum]KAJ5794783.1 hypothetical protein N7457_001382 [Penicillium paradoxum]
MKPVVSALNAWSCVVISAFAMIILTVLGSLYSSNNHAYTGSEGEPEDGPAVAASIYTAVIVYAVSHSLARILVGSIVARERNRLLTIGVSTLQGFFVFCGFQAYLHMRGSRGGAISLH